MFEGAKLLKLLMISGAGLSPLIYFGIPANTATQEHRKFKWLLEWVGQDLQKKELIKKSDKYSLIGVSKNWQGLNTLADSKDTNIYSLFFKSEVIQSEGKNNKNGKALKGAITLVKINSKGASESEIQIEEISKGEAKKVWLIIAKGESTNSIYLMPVVSLNTDHNKVKEIWQKGVKSIDETDNSQLKDNALKESLKNGFAIVRGGKNINGGMVVEEVRPEEYDAWLMLKRGGVDFRYTFSNEAETNIVYNNAGIVIGKKEDRVLSGGWTTEQWNTQVEDFFPLDIKVMGEQNKLEEKGRGEKRLMQEIQINEKISEIIAVRLDQVVITETGIGRGKEEEIKWGAIKPPTWSVKKLK